MKKFIALAALVLMSMVTTTVYAQESNAQRRADRKAQRDAERARLKAEQQAADAVSYDDAVAALKAQKVCIGSQSGNVPQRADGFRHFQHKLRIGKSGTRYGTGGFQHGLSRS